MSNTVRFHTIRMAMAEAAFDAWDQNPRNPSFPHPGCYFEWFLCILRKPDGSVSTVGRPWADAAMRGLAHYLALPVQNGQKPLRRYSKNWYEALEACLLDCQRLGASPDMKWRLSDDERQMVLGYMRALRSRGKSDRQAAIETAEALKTGCLLSGRANTPPETLRRWLKESNRAPLGGNK